jgi:hypothetical protein
MRLIDLAAVYLVVGLICAVAVGRRSEGGVRRGPADIALALLVWPLFVPVVLGKPGLPRQDGAGGPASGRILRERELLLAALEAVAAGTLGRLLPTRQQIERLVEHLVGLDAKVIELDEVLARDDFDAARAERALGAARQAGGSGLESARLVCESIRRLRALRDRAAAERDELLALCGRLRTQVTVLRFAGTAPEDVGELVGEILARVEGVGAALEPRLDALE